MTSDLVAFLAEAPPGFLSQGTSVARLILSVLVGVLSGCAAQQGRYAVSGSPAPAEIGRIERLPRTQVPFPPGTWIELAREDTGAAMTGKFTHRTYGSVENGKLHALFSLRANLSWDGNGFDVPRECYRRSIGPDPTYTSDVRGAARDFDCYLVWPVAITPPSQYTSKYDSAVYSRAQEFGGLPTDGVAIEVTAGFSHHMQIVTLTRFPSRDGIAGGNWTPGQEGPREQAYIAKLVAWAQAFRPQVVRGVQGRL